jgi:hypothetical protein
MSEKHEELETEFSRLAIPLEMTRFGKVYQVPPEIYKSCLILGVAFDQLTESKVDFACKVTRDPNTMILLNTAKDTLIRWLHENPDPDFDWHKGSDPNQPSGVPRRPLPTAGSGEIAIPLPEPEEENKT